MANRIELIYQHPVVRDLAWVMVSPGLLQSAPEGQSLVEDNWCQKILARHDKKLQALDADPSPLLDALSRSRTHRLGIYFENLLRYWLQEILHVSQLKHNVPVFQFQDEGAKRTIGEFDFLFRLDEKKPLQHWEATVKFYLQKKDENGNACWVGPGDRDRLDIKLDRLFQHQLKLGAYPEANQSLHLELGEQIQTSAFIKGYLFYPLDEDGQPAYSTIDAVDLGPYSLSQNHHKGWWLRWGEQLMPSITKNTRWLVLPKSRWLSAARCLASQERLMDTRALATYCEGHFTGQHRPFLVAEMQSQQGVWQEISRGFVLAPGQ